MKNSNTLFTKLTSIAVTIALALMILPSSNVNAADTINEGVSAYIDAYLSITSGASSITPSITRSGGKIGFLFPLAL